MSMLFESYKGPSIIVPEPNKYYVFVYIAKTRGIEFDQHPFIECSNLFSWGFSGNNAHIGPRQYTWQEVRSNLLEIPESQVQIVNEMPIAKLRSS